MQNIDAQLAETNEEKLNRLESTQNSLLLQAQKVSLNLTDITISLALTLEAKYLLLDLKMQISGIAQDIAALYRVNKVVVNDRFIDDALNEYPRFKRAYTTYDDADPFDIPAGHVAQVHSKAMHQYETLNSKADDLTKKIKSITRRINSLEFRANFENITLLDKFKTSKLRIQKAHGYNAPSLTAQALIELAETFYDIVDKVNQNSPAIDPILDEEIAALIRIGTKKFLPFKNDKNIVDAEQKNEFSKVAQLKGKYMAPKARRLMSNLCPHCSPKKIKTFDYDPNEYEEMVFYPEYTDNDNVKHRRVWVCMKCGHMDRMEVLMSWENIEKSVKQTYEDAQKLLMGDALFVGIVKWFRKFEQPKRLARVKKLKHKFSNSS